MPDQWQWFKTVNDLSVTEILKPTLKLAKQAGRAILEVYQQTEVKTTYKDDKSPLTAADLASHNVLVAGLNKLTPEIPILSEESKTIAIEERQSWRRFWLLDPLDGTKEFIKRNGEFTVNIALIESGVPVLGVVYAPVLNTAYWGLTGQGAFKQVDNNEPQAIEVQLYKEGALKLVASRSHANAETVEFIDKLKADFSVETLSIGSSLKLCLVAEGKAHIYPRFGPTMEWDTAAAQCVVEQAKGKVSTLQGEPLRYNKDDLLNPYFIVSNDYATWSKYS